MEIIEIRFLGRDGNKKYYRDNKGNTLDETGAKVSLSKEYIQSLDKSEEEILVTRKEE